VVFVELRPHIVRQPVRKGDKAFGTIAVELDQYQIYVLFDDAKLPTRYGYVCKHAGAPINALMTLPDSVKGVIESEVLRLLAEKSFDTTAPRRVVDPTGFQKLAPVEDLEEVEDFDDEDE
jgi:hypothetical protein